MENQWLHYKNSLVSYRRFGTGPKLVLCFHGYSEEAVSFEFLGNLAAEQFTFYAINLPFHGQTQWKEGLLFTHKDLQLIIEGILNQDNYKPSTKGFTGQISNHNLTLIGFSLGGRIALSLYQLMPEQIEKVILLAPDGLKINFWYWLATQTWLGNKFFAFTMKHPGWFFGFLKLLNKLGLANISVFKFANYYIGDKEVRKLLYERWTAFRRLKPNLSRIKSFIKQYKTPVRLVYGKHDRIILSSVGEKFRKGMEEQCTLTVIHSGHQVLHEKHAPEILPLLLD